MAKRAKVQSTRTCLCGTVMKPLRNLAEVPKGYSTHLFESPAKGDKLYQCDRCELVEAYAA